MRTLMLMALLATSPAHAIVIQLTQTGVLEDGFDSPVSLTAFARGDRIISSSFAPYGFDPTYIDPDFSLEIFDIQLAVGASTYSHSAGSFSLVGDLMGPAGYEAAWWFDFGGWSLSIFDGRLSDAITSAEAALWSHPEAQALLTADFDARAFSLQDPLGTRTRFAFRSGDLTVQEVPEPATVLLFGSGLLLLGWRSAARSHAGKKGCGV